MTGVARRPVAERLRRWLIARCAPISIDGQTVQSITIDGEDVTEVTMDGQTVFKSNAIPDSVIDHFETSLYEDQGLSLSDRYGGDVSEFDRQQNTVQDGSYALLSNTGSGSFAGTEDFTVQQGETFEYWMRTSSGDGMACFWAVQDETSSDGSESGYGIYWLQTQDRVRLRKYDNGYDSDLASNSDSPDNSYPVDAWVRFEVDWQSDGTMAITIDDGGSTTYDTLTGSDTQFSSGGIGFRSYGDNTDLIWDEVRYV